MSPRAWCPKRLRWDVAAPYNGAAELARELRTSPLIAQILHNRGSSDVETAQAFLTPKLSDLLDPKELPGTAAAAQRIAQAIKAKQRIVIYGDYDVDGIASVAILHACIRTLGAEAHFYVPHRLEEGYGVNARAVEKLIHRGMDLLITVDCGISDTEPLRAAGEAGVDVIITDHHNPPQDLPTACAVVHPAIPGGGYPNPDLSGAGVAFKLAWEVARTVSGQSRLDEPMRNFLLDATGLAALGTIADVVPLVGENRVLATYGLRGLAATDHVGLRALIHSAGLRNEKLDAYHVGFRLAPRLNAAGRMGHARLAVELLTDANPQRAKQIAELLGKANTQRQQIEKATTAEAVQMVQSRGLDSPENRAIVLASDEWHGGVIGIVASRLVERFGRPAILIAINAEGVGQGSGRSIPGFHMRDALAACSKHLKVFGGHAMAGGLRIHQANIDAFEGSFCSYAAGHINEAQTAPSLWIDAETTVEKLSYDVVRRIGALAPFGRGNPAPVVAIRKCNVLTGPKRIGRNGQTVTMLLGQNGASIRAVGFGMGDLADLLVGVREVDVAAEPCLNCFNGKTTAELKLQDVVWD